jgi:DNA-binding LacI/PurR family transcriptional regulator
MREASLTHQSGIFLSIRSQDTDDIMRTPDAPEIQVAYGRNGVGLTHMAFCSSTATPTAIICWNEEFAREAMITLSSLGLSVPADVSVVCFDDAEAESNSKPTLTTMRQPLRQIGMRAVDLLIDRTLNLDLPAQEFRFKAELVIRDSASPCSSHLYQKAILPTEVIIQ